jgi:O-antigen biosynthesis protein
VSQRIAVVTAVAGDFDYDVSNRCFLPDVDYIFYVKGFRPKSKYWKVRPLPDLPLDNRRLAKFPKLHPHYFEELRNYDIVIWVDGSMQIISPDFVDEILGYLGDGGLLLSPHFDGRDCGYGEATIRPDKYKFEPLDEQCAFYRSDGFPEHFGLWEAGIQARRMNYPGLSDFGAFWLGQNLMWSYQDQVSLGYSLWKTGFEPKVMPKSWREFNWVHLNAHKSER